MASMNYQQYLPTQPGKPAKGTTEFYAWKYDTARKNLLAVVIMTTLNLVLLLAGSDSYLLFSATIPYYLPALVKMLPLDQLVLIFCYAVSLVCLICYVLCWLLSKQRSGWMIFMLVLFVLDSLGLAFLIFLSGAPADWLLDILFHVWILYYLISGVRNSAKLKRAVVEEDKLPLEYMGPELE